MYNVSLRSISLVKKCYSFDTEKVATSIIPLNKSQRAHRLYFDFQFDFSCDTTYHGFEQGAQIVVVVQPQFLLLLVSVVTLHL